MQLWNDFRFLLGWPRIVITLARGSPRHVVGMVIGLLVVPASGVAAQEVRYDGQAVNRGYSANSGTGSISAPLMLTAGDASGDAAYLQVSPPLSGSGDLTYAAWADSILFVTASAPHTDDPQVSVDSIVWLGTWGTEGGFGTYAVIAGAAAGQGGSWRLDRVYGPPLRRTPRPPASLARRVAEAITAWEGEPYLIEPDDSTGGTDWVALPVLLFLMGLGALFWFRWRARDQQAPPARTAGDASTQAFSSRRAGTGYQYGVACPICGTAQVAVARELWFMRGFVLAAQFGKRTVVGCSECALRASLRALGVNAIAGWWCFPWGIGTPLVLLQNLMVIALGRHSNRIEDVLRAAGIDPAEVRLDSHGLTREQRELLRAAGHVLATALWADRTIEPKEYARALTVLQQFAGGRITPERAAEFLKAGDDWTGNLSALSYDLRETLLQMALDIALADGKLVLPEIAMLHALAKKLGFSAGAVESLLDEVFGRRPGATRGSGESRQRRRPTRADDLGRAATILGVAATATMVEVKQAWRQAMLRYHPDRSRGDRKVEAELTKRAQEINWAHEILKQHAAAGVHA